jgi:hypothetical protein
VDARIMAATPARLAQLFGRMATAPFTVHSDF